MEAITLDSLERTFYRWVGSSYSQDIVQTLSFLSKRTDHKKYCVLLCIRVMLCTVVVALDQL